MAILLEFGHFLAEVEGRRGLETADPRLCRLLIGNLSPLQKASDQNRPLASKVQGKRFKTLLVSHWPHQATISSSPKKSEKYALLKFYTTDFSKI